MREVEVTRHAPAAMRLHRIVEDAQRHIGRLHLDHRDFLLRGLVAGLVHHVGGLEAQQPRHLDVDPRARDPFLPDAVIGDALAEGGAGDEPPRHRFDRAFGDADRAHAMVDAPRPEPPLRDLEPPALAQQDVVDRHAHVGEADFAVPMRGMVIAIDRQHPLDPHARRVERDQHHALLPVARGAGVGLAHQDADPAARVADPRRPPFAAVDDIMVAIAIDARFDVCGVGGGDRRLGHQEDRADLAMHQRPQPFLLLRQRAVAVQHLHVAGIGGGAVEAFAGPVDPPHFLGAQRIFEVRELRALEHERVVDMGLPGMRGHEEIPQPGGLGACLHVLDHGEYLPRIAVMVLAVVLGTARRDLPGDEIAYPIAEMRLALAEGEIHRASSPSLPAARCRPYRMFGKAAVRVIRALCEKGLHLRNEPC